MPYITTWIKFQVYFENLVKSRYRIRNKLIDTSPNVTTRVSKYPPHVPKDHELSFNNLPYKVNKFSQSTRYGTRLLYKLIKHIIFDSTWTRFSINQFSSFKTLIWSQLYVIFYQICYEIFVWIVYFQKLL